MIKNKYLSLLTVSALTASTLSIFAISSPTVEHASAGVITKTESGSLDIIEDGSGFDGGTRTYLQSANGFNPGDDSPHDGIVAKGDSVVAEMNLRFLAGRARTVSVRLYTDSYNKKVSSDFSWCKSGSLAKASWNSSSNTCSYAVPAGAVETISRQFRLPNIASTPAIEINGISYNSATSLQVISAPMWNLSTQYSSTSVSDGAITGTLPIKIQKSSKAGYNSFGQDTSFYSYKYYVDVSNFPEGTTFRHWSRQLTPRDGVLEVYYGEYTDLSNRSYIDVPIDFSIPRDKITIEEGSSQPIPYTVTPDFSSGAFYNNFGNNTENSTDNSAVLTLYRPSTTPVVGRLVNEYGELWAPNVSGTIFEPESKTFQSQGRVLDRSDSALYRGEGEVAPGTELKVVAEGSTRELSENDTVSLVFDIPSRFSFDEVLKVTESGQPVDYTVSYYDGTSWSDEPGTTVSKVKITPSQPSTNSFRAEIQGTLSDDITEDTQVYFNTSFIQEGPSHITPPSFSSSVSTLVKVPGLVTHSLKVDTSKEEYFPMEEARVTLQQSYDDIAYRGLTCKSVFEIGQVNGIKLNEAALSKDWSYTGTGEVNGVPTWVFTGPDMVSNGSTGYTSLSLTSRVTPDAPRSIQINAWSRLSCNNPSGTPQELAEPNIDQATVVVTVSDEDFAASVINPTGTSDSVQSLPLQDQVSYSFQLYTQGTSRSGVSRTILRVPGKDDFEWWRYGAGLDGSWSGTGFPGIRSFFKGDAFLESLDIPGATIKYSSQSSDNDNPDSYTWQDDLDKSAVRTILIELPFTDVGGRVVAQAQGIMTVKLPDVASASLSDTLNRTGTQVATAYLGRTYYSDGSNRSPLPWAAAVKLGAGNMVVNVRWDDNTFIPDVPALVERINPDGSAETVGTFRHTDEGGPFNYNPGIGIPTILPYGTYRVSIPVKEGTQSSSEGVQSKAANYYDPDQGIPVKPIDITGVETLPDAPAPVGWQSGLVTLSETNPSTTVDFMFDRGIIGATVRTNLVDKSCDDTSCILSWDTVVSNKGSKPLQKDTPVDTRLTDNQTLLQSTYTRTVTPNYVGTVTMKGNGVTSASPSYGDDYGYVGGGTSVSPEGVLTGGNVTRDYDFRDRGRLSVFLWDTDRYRLNFTDNVTSDTLATGFIGTATQLILKSDDTFWRRTSRDEVTQDFDVPHDYKVVKVLGSPLVPENYNYDETWASSPLKGLFKDDQGNWRVSLSNQHPPVSLPVAESDIKKLSYKDLTQPDGSRLSALIIEDTNGNQWFSPTTSTVSWTHYDNVTTYYTIGSNRTVLQESAFDRWVDPQQEGGWFWNTQGHLCERNETSWGSSINEARCYDNTATYTRPNPGASEPESHALDRFSQYRYIKGRGLYAFDTNQNKWSRISLYEGPTPYSLNHLYIIINPVDSLPEALPSTPVNEVVLNNSRGVVGGPAWENYIYYGNSSNLVKVQIGGVSTDDSNPIATTQVSTENNLALYRALLPEEVTPGNSITIRYTTRVNKPAVGAEDAVTGIQSWYAGAPGFQDTPVARRLARSVPDEPVFNHVSDGGSIVGNATCNTARDGDGYNSFEPGTEGEDECDAVGMTIRALTPDDPPLKDYTIKVDTWYDVNKDKVDNDEGSMPSADPTKFKASLYDANGWLVETRPLAADWTVSFVTHSTGDYTVGIDWDGHYETQQVPTPEEGSGLRGSDVDASGAVSVSVVDGTELYTKHVSFVDSDNKVALPATGLFGFATLLLLGLGIILGSFLINRRLIKKEGPDVEKTDS